MAALRVNPKPLRFLHLLSLRAIWFSREQPCREINHHSLWVVVKIVVDSVI